MITNVSWTNYLIVVLLLLVLYYLFIGVRYYFSELKNFASSWNQLLPMAYARKTQISENANFSYTTDSVGGQGEAAYGLDTIEVTVLEVEHLTDKLKGLVEKSSLENLNEEKFKEALRSVLSRYPEIKTSAFQEAVNELIISECQKYGSIKLTEGEVVMLWDDV